MKGTRNIQAFDEMLGRWESAKILEELDDGQTRISFVGWGKDYDTVVGRNHIRDAVEPFDSEVGSVSRRVRRETTNERIYLSQLRSLVAGMKVLVRVDGTVQEGEVKEVDRFRRMLVVIFPNGEKEIHASFLCAPQEVHSIPKKKRKKKTCRPVVPTINDHVPAPQQVDLCGGQVETVETVKEPEEQLYFSAINHQGDLLACGDVGQFEMNNMQLHFGLKVF